MMFPNKLTPQKKLFCCVWKLAVVSRELQQGHQNPKSCISEKTDVVLPKCIYASVEFRNVRVLTQP
jgi:hypothetical protein